ncbi:hypothetical protein [Sphaerospermopsis torques-reginae]|uniref:hypothetical protein n=1 Tax=Sphaerospermopsis torques-reginae TaxID=984207 RepID=UPI001FE47959|nr:hypothetical protein [Sphaerospermopsis torques-reginae]
MFITQATLIPVLWKTHLISQFGTIVCYLGLYIIYHPEFKHPLYFYVENSIYLLTKYSAYLMN